MSKSINYVIEHMEQDDEGTKALPDWVKLEYSHMLNLIGLSSHLHFTSLSSTSIPPLQEYLSSNPASSKLHTHTKPILELLSSSNPPIPMERVCLLDPRAEKVLAPEDGDKFDYFLYGGILGDDPPRDRTAELRKLGFEGRHLDTVQMTTDTAVGVTKKVVEDKIKLNEIPYTDFPTIQLDEHESIEMPFRYVKDPAGNPVMPPGMKEHWKADMDRTIDDF